jgi:hypothetical protein
MDTYGKDQPTDNPGYTDGQQATEWPDVPASIQPEAQPVGDVSYPYPVEVTVVEVIAPPPADTPVIETHTEQGWSATDPAAPPYQRPGGFYAPVEHPGPTPNMGGVPTVEADEAANAAKKL